MYIPSDVISKMIQSEQYGVWAESYENGNSAALIIKIPSSSLKAIIQGCKIQLFIGITTIEKDKIYLTIGVQIFDSIDSPLLVPMAVRTKKEESGIKILLNKQNFVIALFDELNTNICSATGKISNSIFSNIDISQNFLLADNLKLVNEILDSFCHIINPDYGTQQVYPSLVYNDQITISNIKTHLCISVSDSNAINYEVGKGIEGEIQENQIHHFLSIIFNAGIFYSPQVVIGNKTRELTDVFLIQDNLCCLIESKALSINESGFNKTFQRKQSQILKSVRKALKQLEGGIKAIQRNEEVKDTSGNSIKIPYQPVFHCFIVISEFKPTQDWHDVIKTICDVFDNTNGMIHVMDISEFVYNASLSQQSEKSFLQALNERFALFYENKNLNIKSMDSSLPFSFSE